MALRFTIVTPTLNRRAMLSEALASVAAQDWENVEHVIADGGSSDGTPELLASAANVRIIAGPDGGIYDGLNKALAAATGDVVGWLNSDDLYAPGAFAAAAAALTDNPTAAAVCGAAQIECDGVVERTYSSELVADLSPGAILIGPTLPNAWFFRRNALMRVGPFADDLRYAADSDFMQRFAASRPTIAVSPALFYRYRRHAGSATLRDDNAADAVRLDMLRLAQKWRGDIDPAVSSAAQALEGRCRIMLAMHALAAGRLGSATAYLMDGAAVAHGAADYAARRIAPSLRRRRLGLRP